MEGPGFFSLVLWVPGNVGGIDQRRNMKDVCVSVGASASHKHKLLEVRGWILSLEQLLSIRKARDGCEVGLFPSAVVKYPGRSSLREKGFVRLTVL